MRTIQQLQCLVSTLTPSELDGINELKAAFRLGLERKSLAELELLHTEVEGTVAVLGERLVELRSELAILLARSTAITDAREQRPFVVAEVAS